MVEGTGLENQRRKRPQVRILSFPPKISPLGPIFNDHFSTVDVFSYHYVCDYYYDFASKSVAI